MLTAEDHWKKSYLKEPFAKTTRVSFAQQLDSFASEKKKSPHKPYTLSTTVEAGSTTTVNVFTVL